MGAGSGHAVSRRPVSRRTALRAGAGAALLAAVPSCASPFADTRLALATGGTLGVYYRLGTALAAAWRDELGLNTTPAVRATAGSLENLQLLATGFVDVAFSQVDTAADRLAGSPSDDRRAMRALARIYDDAVHVVVRESSPVQSLADLRGLRVSTGAPNSGVSVLAARLLAVAGLRPEDLQASQLGINDSVAAMRDGEIDAFFWSGGVPTEGVAELARSVPIRLLDLAGQDVLARMRERHPVYAPGTVPAMSYGIRVPVTTLLVRNFLLVPAQMPDALAKELVRALFAARERLAVDSPAALTIDPRAAIGTQPVPLHPGAVAFYREDDR